MESDISIIYRGNILYRGRQINKDGVLMDWVYGQVVNDSFREKCTIYQHDEDLRLLYGYEVLPETVSQYTGVDYFGGKLYGGDLIQFKEKPLGIDNIHSLKVMRVFWMYHEWVMMTKDGAIFDIGLLVSNPKSFDVIGNYFDNPEVLVPVEEYVERRGHFRRASITPRQIYARRREQAKEGGWESDYIKEKNS